MVASSKGTLILYQKTRFLALLVKGLFHGMGN